MYKTFSILALAAFAGLLHGQETPSKPDEQPTRYYRLDFVVKDFQDGKVLDARNYFVFVADRNRAGRPTSIRAESRVPVVTGSSGSYQGYDLDVGIDCGYRAEMKDGLALDISVDVTTLVPAEHKSETQSLPPIVRKNRWASDVFVALRKPTTIFSSDDLESKGKLQVELTATPISQ